jgi:hypothetical protein
MTTTSGDPTPILERNASVVRSRLLRTLDVLARRRHRAVAAGKAIERNAFRVGAIVVGVLAVAGAAAALLALRPSRPRRPSFVVEAARRVALTLLGVAANAAGKRAVHLLAAAKKVDELPQGSVA